MGGKHSKTKKSAPIKLNFTEQDFIDNAVHEFGSSRNRITQHLCDHIKHIYEDMEKDLLFSNFERRISTIVNPFQIYTTIVYKVWDGNIVGNTPITRNNQFIGSKPIYNKKELRQKAYMLTLNIINTRHAPRIPSPPPYDEPPMYVENLMPE